jgi:hypothetical protein
MPEIGKQQQKPIGIDNTRILTDYAWKVSRTLTSSHFICKNSSFVTQHIISIAILELSRECEYDYNWSFTLRPICVFSILFVHVPSSRAITPSRETFKRRGVKVGACDPPSFFKSLWSWQKIVAPTVPDFNINLPLHSRRAFVHKSRIEWIVYHLYGTYYTSDLWSTREWMKTTMYNMAWLGVSSPYNHFPL